MKMARPRKKVFVPRKIWLYPHGIEREYKSLMQVVIDACKTAVALNMGLIESIVKSSPFKNDEVEYWAEVIAATEIARRIIELSAKLQESFSMYANQQKIERELKKVTSRANEFNSKQFKAVLRSALQVDVFQHEPELNNLLGVWAQENVRLIKTIPTQYFGEIERITSEGFKTGALTRDIASQIETAGGVSQKRAFFIARDQMGSLNGDLTRYRQTNVGIDSYVWHTSGDSRVRLAHARRSGETFRWDSPPFDGHPGKPANCRCVALPVIDLDRISVAGMPIPKGRR